MLSKQIKKRGILAKLLEAGIKIFLKKECKKVGNVKIDIVASSIQILKGIIEKIEIKAEKICYKDLIFDKIELEANEVKINFQIQNKELEFKNNFIVNFTISLSETSLNKILLSDSWNWIGDMISKEILNRDKLEDLKIINNQISIKALESNNNITQEESVILNTEDGKIYFKDKSHNKSIQIPLEDKVYIKNLIIKNNKITISAYSSISF